MISIPVATPSRSYEVLIGRGLIARAGECLGKFFENNRAFVVTVPPVRRRWARVLLQSLAAAGIEAEVLEMPDGERSKRLTTLEKLAERLVKQGADRGGTLIALGGGVVGDVTGFLASIYMRGVDVIQVPTTVLAQVDAAIGGKTGVNLASGKNLLGTFHQPRAVLVDPSVLETLPSREYHAGLYATPLLVVLLVVETSDILFAVDSIPAVLAITLNAFIVYTSNVFAILGLRSMYFALAGMMEMFRYLHYGLSLVLIFVGAKMLLSHYFEIPTPIALGVVAGVLAISVIASLANPRKEAM